MNLDSYYIMNLDSYKLVGGGQQYLKPAEINYEDPLSEVFIF
jgi:hypothetical protein